MNILNSREYCLHHMGIKEWQLRVEVEYNLILINEDYACLSPEKKQLLQRMREALGWSVDCTRIIALKDQADEKKVINQQSKLYNLKKVLALTQENEIDHLPMDDQSIQAVRTYSLSSLLLKNKLKRTAWERMKILRT